MNIQQKYLFRQIIFVEYRLRLEMFFKRLAFLQDISFPNKQLYNYSMKFWSKADMLYDNVKFNHGNYIIPR